MNKKPHKHAELIKAWADGAEIQLQNSIGGWMDEKYPAWNLTAVYRIKPEPKPDVVRYACYDRFQNSEFMQLRLYRVMQNIDSPTGQLKLTFDGETGTLKSAEVLE